MRRLVLVACVAGIAATAGIGSAASARDDASLCVRANAARCYSTIQAALNAAHDGDTIQIGPGTFSGGVTVTTSVRIEGAGTRRTIITGGGPVVTVGQFGSTNEPTVSLSQVTITGGVTHSAAQCGPECGTNYVDATALGGGIEIAPGATLTLVESGVSGNRAAPSTTVPSVRATCGGIPCRAALAGGGGIDDWGSLTVKNSTIADNEVGGQTSDADGGGLLVEAGGAAALENSTVTGNHAVGSIPYGRFAEGGGIFVDHGVLTLANSVIRNNRADLTTGLGDEVNMNANSGGIHAGDGGSVTIENTRIDDNVVTVTDLAGEPAGFDAGICVCGSSPLVMRSSSVSNNHVIATVRSTEDSGASGSAFEFDGTATIANSRIVGNTVEVTSPTGVAGAIGAISAFAQGPEPAVISDSVISGNTATASSSSGSATVQGLGINNNGLLELRNDVISDNVGTATGPAGFAQGGGIWNGVLFFDPPVTLTLDHTQVLRNSVSGNPGLDVRGGGLFTTFPVVLDHSRIAQNAPDQCVGC